MATVAQAIPARNTFSQSQPSDLDPFSTSYAALECEAAALASAGAVTRTEIDDDWDGWRVRVGLETHHCWYGEPRRLVCSCRYGLTLTPCVHRLAVSHYKHPRVRERRGVVSCAVARIVRAIGG